MSRKSSPVLIYMHLLPDHHFVLQTYGLTFWFLHIETILYVALIKVRGPKSNMQNWVTKHSTYDFYFFDHKKTQTLKTHKKLLVIK